MSGLHKGKGKGGAAELAAAELTHGSAASVRKPSKKRKNGVGAMKRKDYVRALDKWLKEHGPAAFRPSLCVFNDTIAKVKAERLHKNPTSGGAHDVKTGKGNCDVDAMGAIYAVAQAVVAGLTTTTTTTATATAAPGNVQPQTI